MPIKLHSSFEAFLLQCSAYDMLESAIAVVDTQGTTRYANQAFVRFNKTVRDSVQNLTRYGTLLECPEISSWLMASQDTSNPNHLRHTFFYSPRIQVELTLCSTCLLTQGDAIAGALLTVGEESIAFNQRHLAQVQDSYRTLAERIKVLDKQKIDTQDLLNVLLKDAPVAMVLFNDRRDIIQLNHAASILFKTSIAEVRGKPCEHVFPCFGKFGSCPSLDLHNNIKNELFEMVVSGKTLSLLRSVAVLQKLGSEVMIVEAFIDVTERLVEEKKRIEYEKQLETLNRELEARVATRTAELNEALERANKANAAVAYLADYDALTGIFNRRRFQDELVRWGKYSLRYERPGALMFIDLDKFKSINDSYGHMAGDEYLLAISGLLKNSLRATDCLGRWGGDEFVALLPEINAETSLVVANKLLKTFSETKLSIAGQSMHASVSIGIAVMLEHTSSISELMDFADAAMYKAKESGRGCCCLYAPQMQSD